VSKPAKIAATAKPPGTSPAAELELAPVELEELPLPVGVDPPFLVEFPELPEPVVAFPVGELVRELTAPLGRLLPQRDWATVIALARSWGSVQAFLIHAETSDMNCSFLQIQVKSAAPQPGTVVIAEAHDKAQVGNCDKSGV